MAYDVGQQIWAEATFSVDGGPATPTTITLTWREPNGEVSTFGIADLEMVEEGLYRKAFTLDAPGVFVANWVSTGPGAGADEQTYAAGPSALDGFGLGFFGANAPDSDRDALRMMVGDTTESYLLRDLDYDRLLSLAAGEILAAAVLACNAIAGRFATDIDASNADVSKSESQRAGAYRELAASYQVALDAARHQATVVAARGHLPMPFAGGSDRAGYFALAMMDRPGNTRPFGDTPGDPRAGT